MDTDEFLAILLRNPKLAALFDELSRTGLRDAWIVAGCLTQTVWNAQTGRAIDHGIDDYDVFYFDSDLSWEAENRVITGFRRVSQLLNARIEVRNQARVHLWYQEKHRLPYAALLRATDGIDRFLTRCTQVGVHRNHDGDHVYAPHGFADIAGMIVRPNLTPNFSPEAYRRKTARWQAMWPELKVDQPQGSTADQSI